MPRIRMRDANNVLRTITRIRMRDNNNVLRTISRIRMRDNNNVLRTVWPPAPPQPGTFSVNITGNALASQYVGCNPQMLETATITAVPQGGIGPYTYLWEVDYLQETYTQINSMCQMEIGPDFTHPVTPQAASTKITGSTQSNWTRSGKVKVTVTDSLNNTGTAEAWYSIEGIQGP